MGCCHNYIRSYFIATCNAFAFLFSFGEALGGFGLSRITFVTFYMNTKLLRTRVHVATTLFCMKCPLISHSWFSLNLNRYMNFMDAVFEKILYFLHYFIQTLRDVNIHWNKYIHVIATIFIYEKWSDGSIPVLERKLPLCHCSFHGRFLIQVEVSS